MILNLGAGNNQRKDCINVDRMPHPGINQIVDLRDPWPWADRSIDGIYASHLIEHLNQESFIWESLRVLKKGGFLQLSVPHSSSVSSVGSMGHNRTYSYSTLDDFIGKDNYMFGKAKFKTVYQRLNWWYENSDTYSIMNKVLSYLGNLSPQICENLWIYWVGGFREVIWKGIKL